MFFPTSSTVRVLSLSVALFTCSAQAPITTRTTGIEDPIAARFVDSYNAWAIAHNSASSGTFSATEFRRWKETKESWNALRKRADLYYNQ